MGWAAASLDLTSADLERLSAVVGERSGLAFAESRWPFLRNRGREVMVRSGFTSTRRWMEELEASAGKRGALYCQLEEALQVHETSFFRYEEHQRILRERILPELIRTGGLKVRIASVGCSTGEEPYSIAMTLRESVRCPFPCSVEVVAVDLSRQVLGQAVNGTYSESRVTAVPPAYVAKYFVKAPAGFTVAPALRQMVRFRHHDIRRGFYIGKFDVVFCCNVLHYFTPAMKRETMARLAESLVEGGYLFLGHAEEITPPAGLFEPRDLPAGFVYQRVSGSPAGSALDGAARSGGALRRG